MLQWKCLKFSKAIFIIYISISQLHKRIATEKKKPKLNLWKCKKGDSIDWYFLPSVIPSYSNYSTCFPTPSLLLICLHTKICSNKKETKRYLHVKIVSKIMRSKGKKIGQNHLEPSCVNEINKSFNRLTYRPYDMYDL